MAMRDKIEEIVSQTQPRIRFQLVRLEKVEDWVAYTNIIQTLGLKVSAAWRLVWGDRLYYIIDGITPNKAEIRIMTRVEKRDEKTLAEYYIQNVVRYWIRDKTFDEFLKEIMRWL
jgi:hypothetical protein